MSRSDLRFIELNKKILNVQPREIFLTSGFSSSNSSQAPDLLSEVWLHAAMKLPRRISRRTGSRIGEK
jgi:hypothetical protein